MSDVTVVVPWAPGCGYREAARAHVVQRWASARLPVVLGRASADHPWRKAAAVADALTRVDAEILVIADADVWTDGVFEAIDVVRAGAPWAVPHQKVLRLTPEATQSVFRGQPLVEGLPTQEKPYKGVEGGGMVVLRRVDYLRAPLDHRFAGWGQEDESWAIAMRTVIGEPWRGEAPLFHLWHPPQKRRSRRFGSAESKNLFFRYLAAKGRPELMNQLLDEPRREVCHGARHTARTEGEPASPQPACPRRNPPHSGRRDPRARTGGSDR